MASSPARDLTLGSPLEVDSTVHDPAVEKLGEYLHALQEERGKVEAFKRELPLCLHLIDEAIESTKQRVMEDQCSPTTSLQTSERSKGTPVLENFMPLKRRWENHQKDSKSGHSSDDSEQHHQVVLGRPAWTGEAQLWTQQSTDHEVSRGTKRNVEFGEAKTSPMASSRLHLSAKHRQGGAFVPFIRERHSPEAVPPADDVRISSPVKGKTISALGGHADANAQAVRAYHHGSSDHARMAINQSQGQARTGLNQSQRKTRRCWSPELHRRFVTALQQLGGSQVATPKQIRELMKVDSLTNDEVKSHLQKYRLHTRRPSPSPSSGNASAQAPQLVVLGWMRPDQFQAAVGAAAASQASTGGGVCDGAGPPPSLVVAQKYVPPQSTEQQPQQVEPSPKHASAAISTSHSSLPGPSSVTGGSPNSSSNSYMEEADHDMVTQERKLAGHQSDSDMKEPQQLQPAIESKGSTTSLVDIGINSLRKTKAAA